MRTCEKCRKEFEATEMEKSFLKKVGLPKPLECPACRMRRRFSWRNERKLYYRKCDLSGKQIVSIYAPESDYKVFDHKQWYSDKWNALDYGRDFDFDRPFFEQFGELMKDVPKISVFVSKNENSDYTNGAQQDKNCYMIFVSDHNEDCYYSYAIDSCKDCLECMNCYKCTLCLECIDCSDSYNLSHSEKSHNCRDSSFLYDCKNCENCIACYGLRSKKYHILNKKYSKDEYEKKLAELDLGDYDKLMQLKEFFEHKLKEKQIHQYYDGNNNENVSGDHIVNCRNCINCYDSGDLEDCANLIFSFNSRDCFDGHVVVDKCELCYETVSTINQYNTQFTFVSFYSKNGMYLDHCISCEDCFACSGLRKKKYCIFNKQYSKNEYEQLRARIIEHMKDTNEWGEALPMSLSPFGYNETVAQEYFPITEIEAKNQNLKWREELKNSAEYQGPQISIPKDINEVDDEIVEKILICEKSAKPFKIMPHELRLYRWHKIPLPRLCFDERHMARIAKRNPRRLWQRKCAKCESQLQSSYAPERKELIYCEDCYLKEVY